MADDQPSITCPRCGMTSYNPHDIEQRYCGNCHVFLDDPVGVVVRDATDEEQHAAIVEVARQHVAAGAGHECFEWRMGGKCELCDRPLPLCGRCYDEQPTFPANCAEKPELLKGAALGMYHCPDCGAMVLAGLPHPELCQRCLDRKHPGFDPP